MQCTVRTMVGVLVAVLLLTAGQAMAQLTSEGNQFWHQDSDGIAGQAEERDNFGEALAAGDFNNDGFEDLAIGVPGEDVGAGAVNVIYGFRGGLFALGNVTWAQYRLGIAGEAEEFDNFGRALAAGDFNDDGFEDLAIGVPGEDTWAGAVNVIYGGPDGLAVLGNQLWHQDSDGIAGEAEGRDYFGDALAAGDFNDNGFEDLAIGVPFEETGGRRTAGAVNVLYGAGPVPPQFSSEGIVSAASFLPGAAPAAIMSLFGVNLAGSTEVASEVPLPTSLAGTTVRVTAAPVIGQVSQIIRGALAPLFFTSPGQINFLIPPVPLGPARITVTRTDGSSFSATIEIERVAPALFTADSSGSGVAAAQFIKIAADGTRTQGLIFDPNTLAAVPIDLGSEQDQVFLALFGTGVRGFTSGVTATVGGVDVPVLGAVPQKQFEGVDQVNIGPLPLEGTAGLGNAAGRTLAIVLTVDGRQTNPVIFLEAPDRPPGSIPRPGPSPGPVAIE